MTKYFFCNKFVNEMFLRCNIKICLGVGKSVFCTMYLFAFDMNIAYR